MTTMYDEFIEKFTGDSPLWWSLDVSMAAFMAAGLHVIRDRGNGHPIDMCEDEWDELLTTHGNTLRDYSQQWDNDTKWADNPENWKKLEDALLFVAEHFQQLWD